MIRAVAIMTLACLATVNAGVLSSVVAAPAVSYASGPALGAPLVGRVSQAAPEVTVVKQPITIDQPEIRYRAVPTLVQPQVTYVAHHAPAVVAAPALVAAPAAATYLAGHHHVLSAPTVYGHPAGLAVQKLVL